MRGVCRVCVNFADIGGNLIRCQRAAYLAVCAARPLDRARRDDIERWLEGDGIAAMRTRYRGRKWHTPRIFNEVPLAAEFAAVGQVRAGFLPPRGGWPPLSHNACLAPTDLVVFAQTAQHS